MDVQVEQTQDQQTEVTQDQQAAPEAAASTGSVSPPQAQQPDKGDLSNPIGAEQAAALAAQAPAFNPNFKFKAAQQEMEVPELLRGVIKDQKTQEYIHQLLAKAYGLPQVKEKLEYTRGELNTVKQEYSQVQSAIQDARAAYQRNDFDHLFNVLSVDPNKVLQWAVHKVQLSQMPPEQREAFEAKTAAERRAYELEQQQSMYSRSAAEQQGQYINQMLDLVLERPDYGSVAQAYDARKGQPGAFRNLVVMVGQSEAALSGKTLTPLEAAQKALDWIGEKMPQATPAATAQGAAAPQATATPAGAQGAQTKNIPNLSSGSRPAASPGKPKFRSIDDLKKAHQQIVESNRT